jgi:hypothetical protein
VKGTAKQQFAIEMVISGVNPSPALTYQNGLDLNVACRAKRTQTYWHVRKFKCPLKKTQPSCPCSRDLNWTGKGLIRHQLGSALQDVLKGKFVEFNVLVEKCHELTYCHFYKFYLMTEVYFFPTAYNINLCISFQGRDL